LNGPSTTKNPIHLKFSTVRHVTSFLAGVVIIFGIPLLILLLLDIRRSQSTHSSQLLGLFDEELQSNSNSMVRLSIEDGGALLDENGGPITDDDLEDYLNVFESMSDAIERNLVDDVMLYELQGAYIEDAYQNGEVRDWIGEAREDDPDAYAGFEALARRYMKEDNLSTEPEIKGAPDKSTL
jgi:hypothetical protein